VNPAFFASEIDTGLVIEGVLNPEMIFFTGFRQAGHWVNGAALSGLRKVKRPPQAAQLPSQSSYS
jgi:hypothetical protein